LSELTFKFYSKSEQRKFKSWMHLFMQVSDLNKNSNKLIGMLRALPKFTVKLFMYQDSFMNKNVWWLNEARLKAGFANLNMKGCLEKNS